MAGRPIMAAGFSFDCRNTFSRQEHAPPQPSLFPQIILQVTPVPFLIALYIYIYIYIRVCALRKIYKFRVDGQVDSSFDYRTTYYYYGNPFTLGFIRVCFYSFHHNSEVLQVNLLSINGIISKLNSRKGASSSVRSSLFIKPPWMDTP